MSPVSFNGLAMVGQDMSYIRGFANNAYYRDGFRLPTVIGGGGTTKRDPANLERVEVLKGPGSILFGRAEPGGIVNMVTKQPLDTLYYSMQQQFGSYSFYRTTADATVGKFSTDFLKHTLLLSYEHYRSIMIVSWSQSAPAAFNVFNPVDMTAGPTVIPANYTPYKLSQGWDGYSMQDQVELPFKIFALGAYAMTIPKPSLASIGGLTTCQKTAESVRAAACSGGLCNGFRFTAAIPKISVNPIAPAITVLTALIMALKGQQWPLHSGQGRILVFLSGLACPVLYVTGVIRWKVKLHRHIN